jgi:uncharacterized protein (DUF1697 family)
VKTVLSSGNVVFTAREASEASLERRAEAAITHHLGTAFLTVIRPIEALRELLAADVLSFKQTRDKDQRGSSRAV